MHTHHTQLRGAFGRFAEYLFAWQRRVGNRNVSCILLHYITCIYIYTHPTQVRSVFGRFTAYLFARQRRVECQNVSCILLRNIICTCTYTPYTMISYLYIFWNPYIYIHLVLICNLKPIHIYSETHIYIHTLHHEIIFIYSETLHICVVLSAVLQNVSEPGTPGVWGWVSEWVGWVLVGAWPTHPPTPKLDGKWIYL